jgi:hypothetical protein
MPNSTALVANRSANQRHYIDLPSAKVSSSLTRLGKMATTAAADPRNVQLEFPRRFCESKTRLPSRLRTMPRTAVITGRNSHWRTIQWSHKAWQRQTRPGVVRRWLAGGWDCQGISVGIVTKTVWLAKAHVDTKLLRRFRAEQRRAAPGSVHEAIYAVARAGGKLEHWKRI